MKQITDVRAGEGMRAMGLQLDHNDDLQHNHFGTTTSFTTRPPADTASAAKFVQKVPDYAIGIIVGAVLLAGIGMCIALPRFLNKDDAEDVTQSFL